MILLAFFALMGSVVFVLTLACARMAAIADERIERMRDCVGHLDKIRSRYPSWADIPNEPANDARVAVMILGNVTSERDEFEDAKS